MAALARAKAAFPTGELAAAKTQLQWVIDNAREDEIRDVARLRLAGVLLDEKKYDEALKLLETKPAESHDRALRRSQGRHPGGAGQARGGAQRLSARARQERERQRLPRHHRAEARRAGREANSECNGSRLMARALVALLRCCAALGGCQTVSDAYDRLVQAARPAQPPRRARRDQAVGHAEDRLAGQRRLRREEHLFPGGGRQPRLCGGRGGPDRRFRRDQGRSGRAHRGRTAHLRRRRRRRRHGARRHAQGRGARVRRAGKQLWKAQLSGEVLAPPIAQDGVVVARSGDGRIYGLDAADGKRAGCTSARPRPLSVRTHAGVIAERGAVFAGFPGGRLVALALPTGNVGWESVVALPRGATELERVADVTSLPVVDGERVCAVAYQGRVACFDPQSGTPLWARDMSSIAGHGAGSRDTSTSPTTRTPSSRSTRRTARASGSRTSLPAAA